MSFPDGFLWGSATAAHQIEGNNLASDFWALEHAANSRFAEPSGDACDHYRLFREDIALLADLGLNSFRFSIEWARVEPEDGFFSDAALAHYRDVLEACHASGVVPVVTLHHFTSPKWLMGLGGWEYERTPERFAAYCRTVMAELGDLIPYACTLNEANIGRVIRRIVANLGEGRRPRVEQAPVGLGEGPGASQPGGRAPEGHFLSQFSDTAFDVITRAHTAARAVIREVSPHTEVGLTLALQDVQALPGGEKAAEEVWAELFEDFLPAIAGDDFLGVQNYSRIRVGPEGVAPVPEDAEVTQMGYEFYPQALGSVLRAAASAGLPLIVTENGLATDDDARRVAFVRSALEGLERSLADGVDVRGYLHWTLLDNFEWMHGFAPKFGLIAVDRATQRRTVKESARFLGAIARRNALA
ncbi:family 1 glycosylhydrolase [Yinghuangia sp. ASG 101]|uniref:glycoside hydrolase family 1 protein n=1 Tax=Yinghuangia sp. ASG 101 TaxID=2896848 RepID=UPI001E399407|nr:family 1 glycosylhydrolase [Yinghuangia sp. ASG 101]UGQ12802.1 family 1 glycosylhydrolase [Yinghuangia sp. ASG 101]